MTSILTDLTSLRESLADAYEHIKTTIDEMSSGEARLRALAEKAEAELSARKDRVRELEDKAKAVCWFDWSGIDSDASAAIDALRFVLSPKKDNDGA